MNIDIPTAPAGFLTLLAFFAPYAIAALSGALPFVTKSWQRKAVTIAVAVLLTAVVFVFYYAMTGEPLPNWPVLLLLALVVIAASYALVTKRTAAALERKLSTPD